MECRSGAEEHNSNDADGESRVNTRLSALAHHTKSGDEESRAAVSQSQLSTLVPCDGRFMQRRRDGCSRHAAPIPVADREVLVDSISAAKRAPRAESDTETNDLISMQRLIAIGKGSAIYQWNMAVIFQASVVMLTGAEGIGRARR